MNSGGTIDILLYVAIAAALFSSIGLLVMKGVNERLHYLAPMATLSPCLIAAAIAIQEGFSQAATKAIFSALALALMNPVLTHATARAARIREFGQWVSQPHERERQAGD
jgi:monovalent cation/proton antiporter MnhG/PhaG subunit